MNPYAYVGGNPETMNDPSGQMYAPPGPGSGNHNPPSCETLGTCPGGNGNGGSSPSPAPGHGPCTEGYPLQCENGPTPTKPKSHSVTEGNTITCGEGTILEDNTCVGVQYSKDGQYQKKELSNLYQQAINELLAGYGLSILGDILVILNSAESVVERLEGIVDLAATLATSVIPLIEAKFGEEPSFLSKAAIVLMAVGSAAQGIFAALNGANWWVKTGADIMALAAIDGASGPIAMLQAGLFLIIEPIIGNLLDAGGHALVAKGLADMANYTQQINMPIQNWCTQYGGCPPES